MAFYATQHIQFWSMSHVFWSKSLSFYLVTMQRGNFISTSTSIGVRAQLTTLSTIMKSVDPKLHEHLGTITGATCLLNSSKKTVSTFCSNGASMYALMKYWLCRKS